MEHTYTKVIRDLIGISAGGILQIETWQYLALIKRFKYKIISNCDTVKKKKTFF